MTRATRAARRLGDEDEDDGSAWMADPFRVRAALRRRFRVGDADGSALPKSAPSIPSRGRILPSSDESLRRFADDFRSRAWITYRRNFVPFAGSTYAADAGWGCTMRSGQMLLANALSTHFFGRAWRWRPIAVEDGETDGETDGEEEHSENSSRVDAASIRIARRRVAVADAAAHATLLSWFGDDPSPALCPFGAHAIITGWGRERGVVPGRWLGPCETSSALAALTSEETGRTRGVRRLGRGRRVRRRRADRRSRRRRSILSRDEGRSAPGRRRREDGGERATDGDDSG